MVVRVWKVVEDERSNEIDVPDVDPSCLYFAELAPLATEKQKISMLKSLKKTKNSACVIFPPKVFRISEKPVHEFRGHKGYVLDLSWSKDKFILSSSVDETVRLWRVAMTLVSKSSRTATINSHCCGIQSKWKGGVIGSMTGCCSFFSVLGNRLQLEASVTLNGKKKSLCKRVIGFQFCPQDSSKVMVTSVDCHVRILHGPNVVGKFRGTISAI
ncbi:hypothetical protein M8C21_032787 [Ambrosia artemisiifolia]|uniref:WD repeat-containing protein 44 n=1 Tax=Ambrosia artemisiifolia TaxID=4212 RepID=A0AAD5CKH9_AMBAR|nr:hypothetical protein M8C21_032787 [Ambrosia artemisiifolia]